MKSKKGNIIRFIFFILVFLVLFFAANKILAIKSEVDKSVTLNESVSDPRCIYSQDKETIDVLVLGASQAFTSFNPLQAFHDQGFTSLVMAGPFGRFNISEYYYREMLKTQDPKVVVIEIGPVQAHGNDHPNFLLQEIVTMNPSVEKYETAKSIFPDDFYMRMSAFIPVLAFHDRWEEVTAFDITYWFSEDYLKGFMPVYRINKNPEMATESNDGKTFVKKAKEQLKDLVKLIEDDGREVFLYRSPSTTWTKNQHEEAVSLAEELNVPFIDFNSLYEEMDFDIYKNFYDESHINVWGSKITTEILAETLSDLYGLTDRRNDKAFTGWEENYQRFLKENGAREKDEQKKENQ